MKERSFKEGDDIISFNNLRYVRVLYWGIDDEIHEGEMVVNESVAEDVIEIFKELFSKKYKISQMKLIDCYDTDYKKSISNNNTVSFYMFDNCSTLEEKYHSLGLAIDINPLFNDYLSNAQTSQEETISNEMTIKAKDICHSAFISRGWTWGGDVDSSCKCFFKGSDF